MNLKRIVTAYFGSWWIPSITTFIALIAFLLMSPPNRKDMTIIANGMHVLLALSILGILIAGVWNLFKKHWCKGLGNLLMLPLLLITGLFGLGFFNIGPEGGKSYAVTNHER